MGGVRDDNGERIDVDASGMFAVNLKVFMMTTLVDERLVVRGSLMMVTGWRMSMEIGREEN